MLKIFLVIFATINIGNGWNSTVGFYNHSDESVEIEYTYRSKLRIYTQTATIESYDRFYFTPKNEDQFSVECRVPDVVKVYGIVFGDEKGSFPVPIVELNEVNKSVKSIRLNDTLYYKYVGNPEANYLMVIYEDIIRRVAASIYYDYPDRLDRQLWIGDASPLIGNADGHPSGSHDDKATIDVNYYTLLDRNATQYVPLGESVVSIWEDNDPNNMILNDNIDIERIYEFVVRLKSYLLDENTQIIIHEKIYEKMTQEQQKIIYPIVNLEPGLLYNHHTHMHLRMRAE